MFGDIRGVFAGAMVTVMALLALKASGRVPLSWLAVFSPLWLIVLAGFLLFLGMFIYVCFDKRFADENPPEL